MFHGEGSEPLLSAVAARSCAHSFRATQKVVRQVMAAQRQQPAGGSFAASNPAAPAAVPKDMLSLV